MIEEHQTTTVGLQALVAAERGADRADPRSVNVALRLRQAGAARLFGLRTRVDATGRAAYVDPAPAWLPALGSTAYRFVVEASAPQRLPTTLEFTLRGRSRRPLPGARHQSEQIRVTRAAVLASDLPQTNIILTLTRHHLALKAGPRELSEPGASGAQRGQEVPVMDHWAWAPRLAETAETAETADTEGYFHFEDLPPALTVDVRVTPPVGEDTAFSYEPDHATSVNVFLLSLRER